jgi:hypothetical protein
MKVERRDLIDWESITMTFHSEHDLSDKEHGNLSQLLETWPQAKSQQTNKKGGSFPIPIWLDSQDRKTLRLQWEKWFPQEWIEPLA